MADDVTAIYRLKFKDLASKGLLRTQKIAKGMSKAFDATIKSVGLAGAAIAGAAVVSNKLLAEQVELAKSVGASHKEFDTLRGVASSLGFEFDNIIDLQEELNNKVGEFKVLGELTSLEEGLQGLSINVKEFVKLRPAQQMEALVRAAAKVDQQVASASADMILGGEASKIFGKIRNDIQATGLSVDQYFEKQKKLNFLTDEGRKGAVQFTRVLRDMGRVSGSLVQDTLGKLGGVMEPFIARFKEFVVVNKDLIKSNIDGFLSGLEGTLKSINFDTIKNKALEFKTSLQNIALKAKELIAKFGGLKSIVLGLTGVFVAGKILSFGSALAGVVAVIGGPVTLAIGAAVAAGVLLWKNWDTIKAKAEEMGISVDGVWSFVKKGFILYKDTFIMGLKVMGTIAKGTVTGIVKGFNVMREAFQLAGVGIQKLRAGFSNAWDNMKDKLLKSVQFIREQINKILTQYNRLADTAVGSRLGLEKVQLLSEQATRGAAQSRAALPFQYPDASQTVDVNVDITARGEGVGGEANVTTTSRRGRRGLNIPGGRHAVMY